MNFLFGLVSGMLVPACPEEFYWLLLIIAIRNLKSATGFILGAILISLPQAKVPKKFSAKIEQITPKKYNRATFLVTKPFSGKIIAKSKYNFGQAYCNITCDSLPKAKKWYLLSQDIFAICKLHNCHKLSNYNNTSIPNNYHNSDVFNALLLGKSYLLTPEKKQLFKFAGLAHLLAVSGLHIGIIAGIIGYICGRIWRLCLRFFWRWPQLYFISFGRCFGAILYTWLSNFGDASTRAMTMVLVAIIAKTIKKNLAGQQILYFAMLLVLLEHPTTVFALGFWLSVIAVWALINAGSNLFKAQLYMIIVMLPIQAWLGWPIGWWMPIANILAIPLFSTIIVPGAFGAWFISLFSDKLAHYIWLALDQLLTYFLNMLTCLKTIVGTGYIIPSTGLWQILLMSILVINLLTKRLALTTIIAVILTIEAQDSTKYGYFKTKIIDVHQGLSVLIQTKSHNILIDTGTMIMTKSAVIPALKASNINHLDKILVSHGDNDHSGGLATIANNFSYDEIIAGEPKRTKLKTQPCQHRSWHWDGVVFSTYQMIIDHKHNNASCILHIESPTQSLLLPGDIERNVEHALIANKINLTADILVAAHHGSISSNSKEFIDAVSPKTIVVSAGNYSQYKHPAIANVNYWRSKHIAILNTHNLGSIVFKNSYHNMGIAK